MHSKKLTCVQKKKKTKKGKFIICMDHNNFLNEKAKTTVLSNKNVYMYVYLF